MTTEAQTIEAAPATRPTSGSRRTALVAIVVVALAAAGAALAASKLHSSSGSSAAGGPGGGGFAPSGQMPNGYGFGPGDGGFHGRGLDGGPRGGGGLSAAADYLGISQSTLFSDLRSGKTLAQVAQATSGKSVQGLIDAMVAAETARLTKAQADQFSAEIRSRITDMVNHGFRGPDGDHDFGGPPGSGSDGGSGSAPKSIPGVTL